MSVIGSLRWTMTTAKERRAAKALDHSVTEAILNRFAALTELLVLFTTGLGETKPRSTANVAELSRSFVNGPNARLVEGKDCQPIGHSLFCHADHGPALYPLAPATWHRTNHHCGYWWLRACYQRLVRRSCGCRRWQAKSFSSPNPWAAVRDGTCPTCRSPSALAGSAD